MARVVLASALSRWLPAGTADQEQAFEVAGATVGEALDALGDRKPVLRGYVGAERGRLRHHVAVCVDGQALPRRELMSRPLAAGSSVHLMQALSGG